MGDHQMIVPGPRTFLTILLGGAALVAPLEASAQTATEGTASQLEDIIVTARKREERLIDIPIPISAFTGEDLERRGVTNLTDLQTSVPGLRVIEVGVGGQRIQLRGVSQFLGQPTVGLYIDELSVNGIGAAAGIDVRLIDMERVEVLRGPQPTLYGEGSMGGTIRYVTGSPDLTQFSGRVLAEVGSVSDGGTATRFDGIVNIPVVTDKIGLRLVASRSEDGGWINALGREDVNETEVTTLRGKLLAKLSDQFTASLLIQHEEADQGNLGFSGRGRVSTTRLQTGATDEYTLGNLVMSYDFGPVTLLSTTGFLDREGSATFDFTGAFAPFFPLFGLPANSIVRSDSFGPFESRTQEFRLSSNGSSRLQYTLGALYTDAEATGTQNIVSTPAFPFGSTTQTNGSESWAVFGNIAYDLTDRLQIDIGGRYFEDERSQDQAGPGGVIVQTGTFTTFNPRVSLKYEISDTGMIYVDAAKGFRSGGFNVASALFPLTFGPETLWSYEVGTKQQFFDRRVQIEAAIYYNDYKDVQAVFPIRDGAGLQVATATLNQGAASGPGVDFSALFQATEALSFSATVGYNKIESDVDSQNRFKGDPLDLVPEWTSSFAVDYDREVATGVMMSVHADYGYTDSASIILRNFAPTAFSESRGIFNARLTLTFDRFEAYLFASNLTDEDKIQQPAFGGFPEPINTRPRVIGIGLRADF